MLKESDIIEVTITPDILESAKNFNYPINKKSYMHGERHEVGGVGEVVVQKYLVSCGYNVTFSDTYDYDLLISSANLKIDVKTKKRTPCGLDKLLNYQSKGYEGSVQAESLAQIKQKAIDFYIFVNYTVDKAYIIGWISKDDFVEKCRKVEKNSIDENNGLLMQGENFNIYYRELNAFTK